MRTAVGLAALALALAPVSCNKGSKDEKGGKETKDGKDGKDAKDAKGGKADANGEGGEPTLAVNEGDAPIDGPLPPDESLVFFGVEGALYPLACFDKATKKIESGPACLKMVPPGSDVRLASKFSSFNKKAGELTEPQCMAGVGKKIAIAVEGITEGADFIYATWPRQGVKLVSRPTDDSSSPAKTQLGDTDKAAVAAAIAKEGAKGDVQVNQVAEIDLDGDGKAEKVIAAFVPDPSSPESYRWSGLLVGAEGKLNSLVKVEGLKNKLATFELRGALDLNGDKSAELWLHRSSEDGSAGDRVYQKGSSGWAGVGTWTCGVE